MVRKLISYYDTVIETIEQTEQSIKESLPNFLNDVNFRIGKTDFQFLHNKIDRNKAEWNYIRTYKHTTLNVGRSVLSYIKNGVCFGASARYALYSKEISGSNGLVGANLRLRVGEAVIHGDIKASLLEDGIFLPNISAEVGASVALVRAQVSASIGDERFGAYASADVEVGVAYAEATAVLSKDEIVLESKVGVSAVRGSSTLGFSMFGYKFEFELSGEVGAFNAGVSYKQSTSSLEFGGQLACLLGLGFKVKVEDEGD